MNGDVLRCYVDEETLTWLRKAAEETGREIEQLAEAAIENAAIEYKLSRSAAERGGKL